MKYLHSGWGWSEGDFFFFIGKCLKVVAVLSATHQKPVPSFWCGPLDCGSWTGSWNGSLVIKCLKAKIKFIILVFKKVWHFHEPLKGPPKMSKTPIKGICAPDGTVVQIRMENNTEFLRDQYWAHHRGFYLRSVYMTQFSSAIKVWTLYFQLKNNPRFLQFNI